MLYVSIACVFLLISTVLLHYEVLGLINGLVNRLAIANRLKVLVVAFSLFVLHFLEIVLYSVATFYLTEELRIGYFEESQLSDFETCFYFSAETFTSLGFGDITPFGHIRFLAGFEALNGLLLIGWSATFLYIVMDRFWDARRPKSD